MIMMFLMPLLLSVLFQITFWVILSTAVDCFTPFWCWTVPQILFPNSGYMAPEYAMEGLFSVKSDTYSFGVLLLEILSGKKNSGLYSTDHSQNLLSHVGFSFFISMLWSYFIFPIYEDLHYLANRHGSCGMKTRDLNL